MKTDVSSSLIQKLVLYPWSRFRFHCQEMRVIWRTKGFKALIKHYGWKFFLAVFCYYLVRDVTLYILLPYIVGKSFF